MKAHITTNIVRTSGGALSDMKEKKLNKRTFWEKIMDFANAISFKMLLFGITATLWVKMFSVIEVCNFSTSCNKIAVLVLAFFSLSLIYVGRLILKDLEVGDKRMERIMELKEKNLLKDNTLKDLTIALMEKKKK